MKDMDRNFGYNRNSSSNSYMNNYLSRKSKSNRGIKKLDKKTIERLYMQFLVSCVICLTVIIISNFNNLYVNKVTDSVKWTVGVNYDFKTAVASMKNDVIPGIDNKLKGISGAVGSLINKTDSKDVPVTNSTMMMLPVDGAITSAFGIRDDPFTHEKAQHTGIDIAGDKGTPIKAVLDGVVVKIEENKTIGRAVILRHSDGIETLYGHCSEILVNENQQVKQGDYIAKIGDTGMVTAPHLHFEVIKDGKQIDPLNIIKDVKKSK